MIRVTRLDGSELVVNCDLVETVEHTPDTVMSLFGGHKLVVCETVQQVIDRVVEYRQRIHICPLMREEASLAAVHAQKEQDLDRRGT